MGKNQQNIKTSSSVPFNRNYRNSNDQQSNNVQISKNAFNILQNITMYTQLGNINKMLQEQQQKW